MNAVSSARLRQIAAMLIFGTIGLVVRYIPLSSSLIALVRGAIGTVFLLILQAGQRQKTDWQGLWKNVKPVLFSGACIGFNWILLFESYRYTSIATATLCYYMAPIFVVLAAPLVNRERLSLRRVICVIVAMIGMVGVSGVIDNGLPKATELSGILFGLGAAVLYAAVILTNKRITGLSANDKTIGQLGTAAIVLLPYTLLTGGFVPTAPVTTIGIGALLLVGILHTGIAYRLYFNAMGTLRSQTVAILSYIDPAVAILLSALLLNEAMTLTSGIGAVLILGAALVSELPEKARPE